MHKLYFALLAATLLAACSQKSSERTAATPEPSAEQMDAPAENESAISTDVTTAETMERGADATNEATEMVDNADDIDVDADMPNESDLDADAEYELEENDVEAPAMDEDAVTDGDYVEDVRELNEADNADPVTVEEAREEYAEISPAATLEAVEEAGGLTALYGEGAISTIDRWIVKLETGGSATEVSTKLRELRGLLAAPTVDGPAVGQTLIELGELTQAAAMGNDEVSTLGGALLSAGKELSGQ